MLGQKIFVDSGAIVESFQIAGTDQFAEVLITCFILNQQNEVLKARTPGGIRSDFFVCIAGVSSEESSSGGNIDFAAQDRFEAVLLGFQIKVDSSEHVSMIGQANSGHFIFTSQFEEFIQANGALQQTVLGV